RSSFAPTAAPSSRCSTWRSLRWRSRRRSRKTGANRMPRLGIVTSRIRVEEKLLFEEARRRALEYDVIDDGALVLDLAHPDGVWSGYDAVLCRSVSQSRGLALAHVLETWGVPVFNSAAVTSTCNDKLLTTLALLSAGVPTPRTL